MKVETVMNEYISSVNPKALLADGFEDAIIGYVEGANQNPVALYDRDKCIEILMKEDNMAEVDAWEYFEYNVIGAYMGENTPMFASLLIHER
jgi:hypothetical protein